VLTLLYVVGDVKEPFNRKMRYELLDGEIFYNMIEARTIIERAITESGV